MEASEIAPQDAGIVQSGESIVEHPLARFIVDGYEPHFPRLSTERRVLGHVTTEIDTDALGPRNTFEALSYALVRDDHTAISDPGEVQPHLDALVAAGLLSEADGVYTVTEQGLTELVN